jgi:hypothetical protein
VLAGSCALLPLIRDRGGGAGASDTCGDGDGDGDGDCERSAAAERMSFEDS